MTEETHEQPLDVRLTGLTISKSKSKKKSSQTFSQGNKVTMTERIRVTPEIFDHILTLEDGVTRILPKSWHSDMLVDVKFYLNDALFELMRQEVQKACDLGDSGFLPALTQLINVSCLPGIVKASIGLPDIHSGYGFSIGHVAAFDMADPEAIVSPGGVGYDINCGVRLIRTNLQLKDVVNHKDALTQALFRLLPVGVGVDGTIKVSIEEMRQIMVTGIDWAIEKGYAWPADKLHCEEFGCMPGADYKHVSQKAVQRGLSQLGTIGAGNHYAEIQVVDDIYDETAANAMGIHHKDQVCIMIHCGSRGLGHQVATDYVELMQKVMARDAIPVKDLQLACARITSKEGQNYLKAMAAAANFAYCNRSILTHMTRKAFSDVLGKSSEELEMALVYDVSHNMAKQEDHFVSNTDGSQTTKPLLVHRKGSTRAFCPGHALIPSDYAAIGQPVLVGGSMGTCSHVLTGTAKGMSESFGSTCHGAGRAMSRSQCKKMLPYEAVLANLKEQGISISIANPENISEEAPESYKDVNDVVETCQSAGVSKKAFKLRPIGVIKG